jgi:uncharacterized membrane protein YhaH (DUF805 family)
MSTNGLMMAITRVSNFSVRLLNDGVFAGEEVIIEDISFWIFYVCTLRETSLLMNRRL